MVLLFDFEAAAFLVVLCEALLFFTATFLAVWLALALLAFDFTLLLLVCAADLALAFDLLDLALVDLLLCVAALCALALLDFDLLLWWRAA